MSGRRDAAAGFVLIAASLAALGWVNSPLRGGYWAMLGAVPSLGAWHGLTVHDWVNDGLMAGFFLLVGLEIKREIRAGELASFGRVALPALAAMGGVIVPSAMLALLLAHDPTRLRGWAIPAATDVAFALAALAIVARRAPPALRLFLTAIAVFDDLAAIAIIALFYGQELAVVPLLGATAVLAAAFCLNRARVEHVLPYAVLGIVMWTCTLLGGVNPTLAGVALALALPGACVGRVERRLQPWVAFGVLPVFGLCNAGVDLTSPSAVTIAGILPLGIAAALIFGKQIGIFSFAAIAIRTGLSPLPAGTNWRMLYGVALLGGIGFTMSLFVAALAYGTGPLLAEAKVGIFIGSLVSALAGALVLRGSAPVQE